MLLSVNSITKIDASGDTKAWMAAQPLLTSSHNSSLGSALFCGHPGAASRCKRPLRKMRSRAPCLLLLSILSCVFASPKHELARTLDSPVLADVEGARYVFDINATLPTLQKRACPTDDVAALTTALAMQSLYYNKNGSYNGGEAWTDVVRVPSFSDIRPAALSAPDCLALILLLGST